MSAGVRSPACLGKKRSTSLRAMRGAQGDGEGAKRKLGWLGLERGLDPGYGLLAQVTQISTLASREVTETQIKPFSYSVHGTIYVVSSVSTP